MKQSQKKGNLANGRHVFVQHYYFTNKGGNLEISHILPTPRNCPWKSPEANTLLCPYCFKKPDSNLFFFFFKFFIIVDLQFSVNFCCTAKWPNHTYIHAYIYVCVCIYIYTHSFSHIILHPVPSQVTRYNLAKWVKDLALLWTVMCVADVAGIWHWCGCGLCQQLQLQFDP